MIRRTFHSTLFATLVVAMAVAGAPVQAQVNKPRQEICRTVAHIANQTIAGVKRVAKQYHATPAPKDMMTATNGVIANGSKQWRQQGLSDEGVYRLSSLVKQAAVDVQENFDFYFNAPEDKILTTLEINCYNTYQF